MGVDGPRATGDHTIGGYGGGGEPRSLIKYRRSARPGNMYINIQGCRRLPPFPCSPCECRCVSRPVPAKLSIATGGGSVCAGSWASRLAVDRPAANMSAGEGPVDGATVAGTVLLCSSVRTTMCMSVGNARFPAPFHDTTIDRDSAAHTINHRVAHTHACSASCRCPCAVSPQARRRCSSVCVVCRHDV